jgi:hypothetical protein
MVAHEFQARFNPDGTLNLPEEIARRLTPGQNVRVLVLVQEPAEEELWQGLSTEPFLAGFVEADAIADRLPPC